MAEAPLSSAETRTSFNHCNSRGCKTISVVLSEGLAEAAPEILARTRYALQIAEARWGIPLRDGFTLHFNARPDFHNGQATVVPRNSFFVLTEAPALDSSIGLTRDYLTETLVHEFGHMIPLQGRSGLFAIASAVVGNSSRPVGLWPRWIHEGLAVWTEGAVGGRPESGVLDLELRRYAEAHVRRGTPLLNSDLDGAARFGRTETGDLPYHFGYLLLHRWAQDSLRGETDTSAPIRRMAELSSESLGSSFRPTFREAGENMDVTFASASRDWASTPLPKSATPLPSPADGADEIRGPFGNEVGTSWIAVREGKLRIVSRDLRNPAQIQDAAWRWRESFASPEQVFARADGTWVMLVRRREDLVHGHFLRGGHSVRSLVEVRDARGRLICRPPLPPRLREIDFRRGQLSWVRSTPGGHFFFESAKLDGCALSAPVEHARSLVRFERLSSPFYDGEHAYISRSPNGDAYRERLEIDGVPLVYPRAISFGRPAPPAYCKGESPCVLAHEVSPRHWGPVAIAPESGHVRYLVLRTGSTRSALQPDDTLLVREGLWDEDRLDTYAATAFGAEPQTPAAAPLPLAPPLPPVSVPSADAEKLETYSAWPSIWPHFWWPSVEMGTRGTLIAGQTFFSDTSEEWSGSVQLGYDTFFRRPFAIANLRKTELRWGPLSRMSFAGYSLPSYNYKDPVSARPTQDRWGGRVGLGTSAFFPGELRGDLDLFVGVLQARPALNQEGFTFFVPTLSYGLQSPEGHPARYPGAKAGFRWDGFVRNVRGPETQTGLSGHVPLGRRLTLVAGLQHGWTAAENYPDSYFEWGSLPSFTTYSVNYLTRGFAPYLYAASQIARVSSEAVLSLASPSWALSWNRARLRHIDARVVFESVTLRQPDTPFELGRQYFSTAGLQVEAWGSLLHYVGFNLGAGVFHGFGPYGDTRYMIQLGSTLEI